jgi:hypothetical protein
MPGDSLVHHIAQFPDIGGEIIIAQQDNQFFRNYRFGESRFFACFTKKKIRQQGDILRASS